MTPDADARVEQTSSDRILTVPNVITFVRLCLLPVFVYLLFGADDRAAAAWLLAGLGITDFFDGYIARHFNQISELGKVALDRARLGPSLQVSTQPARGWQEQQSP